MLQKTHHATHLTQELNWEDAKGHAGMREQAVVVCTYKGTGSLYVLMEETGCISDDVCWH